jgi:hypothetical protein
MSKLSGFAETFWADRTGETMSKIKMTLEQVECFRTDWVFPTEDAESTRVNALCDQAALAVELEARVATARPSAAAVTCACQLREQDILYSARIEIVCNELLRIHKTLEGK